MPERYIPPALRRQSVSNGNGEAPPSKPRRPSTFNDDVGLVSAEEVRNFFWPLSDETDGRFSAAPGISKTLHDAASTPGQLAYLFLFKDANPRWETDKLVYTKSSLEMLPPVSDQETPTIPHQNPIITDVTPGDPPETAGTPAADHDTTNEAATPADGDNAPVHKGDPDAPVAIFKQVHSSKQSRSFTFEGWYRIERITYLEPHSLDLGRMLNQKWTWRDRYGHEIKRERDASAWQASLSMRWAVVKFAKHDEAHRERGVPRIERLPDPSEESQPVRRKTINELLAEMRLEGEEVEEESAESVVVTEQSADG